MSSFGEAVRFRELPLHHGGRRLFLLLLGVDAFREHVLPLRDKLRFVEILLLVRLDAVWGHVLSLLVKQSDKIRDIELFLFVRLDAVGEHVLPLLVKHGDKIRIVELFLFVRLDAFRQHVLSLLVKHGDKIRDVEL